MTKPEHWDLTRLLKEDLGRAALLTVPEVAGLTANTMPFPVVQTLSDLDEKLQTLIVVGGGTLLDEAKAWRAESRPDVKLIVVPSLWGSGAEVSSVVAFNRNNIKTIKVGEEFLPDVYVTWEQLADSIPPEMAHYACGDCWAHALEGFLSPLANGDLRMEIAAIINRMIEKGLGKDPEWFELSACACRGQLRAGVGLVHGIAHELEGVLARDNPDYEYGHAKLCSIFLLPVMILNRKVSPKVETMLREYRISESAVFDVLKDLFDRAAYDKVLPALQDNWNVILRNPLSRINCVLVRVTHLAHFMTEVFE